MVNAIINDPHVMDQVVRIETIVFQELILMSIILVYVTNIMMGKIALPIMVLAIQFATPV